MLKSYSCYNVAPVEMSLLLQSHSGAPYFIYYIYINRSDISTGVTFQVEVTFEQEQRFNTQKAFWFWKATGCRGMGGFVKSHESKLPWIQTAMNPVCHESKLPWIQTAMNPNCHESKLPWIQTAMNPNCLWIYCGAPIWFF